MSALTIGSLFAGIGGLELGLERGIGNGARTVWQVEQNAYCRAVLAKHWPDATRYEDVRHVGRCNLTPVDVLCGGFPCQDISYAGDGAGLSGDRSGLWFEYARIIRELQPRYVVVENVTRLLALGLDVVLGELASCGYDAEWDCIPASSIGAPHQRDRLFVLAYTGRGGVQSQRSGGELHRSRRANGRKALARSIPSDAGGGGQAVADTHGVRQLQPQGRFSDERGRINDGGSSIPYADGQHDNDGRYGAGAHGRQLNGSSLIPGSGAEWWITEPNVGRVAHGVPSRVDRLRALGNAVVPQVAEVVGRLIAERQAEREEAA